MERAGVMYFGALPIYPSMPPMMSPTSTGMWPSFLSVQQQHQQPQPQPCPMSQNGCTNPPGSSCNESTFGSSSNGQPYSSSGSSYPTISAPVMSHYNSGKNKKGSPSKVAFSNTEESGTAGSRSSNNERLKANKGIISFSGTVRDQASPPFMLQNTTNKNQEEPSEQLDERPNFPIKSSTETSIVVEMSQLKKKKAIGNKGPIKTSFIDEDSGFPHHNQRQQSQDCERDSVSMTSTSYLLKSDDLSSHSPSDRTENDLEMEFKNEPGKRPAPRVPKDPPWMEGVDMNPDVVFRYQLTPTSLEDVLKKDLKALKELTQPDLLNKQLALLQSELAADVEENLKSGLSASAAGKLLPKIKEELIDTEDILKDQPQTSFGSFKREADLGFTTLEEDVGEELQAKEDEILHLISDNM